MLSDQESREWMRLRKAGARLTEKGRTRLAELDAKTTPETSAGQRAVIGLGRGMLDVGQGAKQKGMLGMETLGLLDPGSTQAYTDEAASGLAEYEKLAAAHPWSTGVGRFAGNVAAAPVPGLGATIPGRIATSGLLGAGIGATEFSPEMSASGALRGALFGGAGGMGGEALGALGQRALAGRRAVPTPLAEGVLEPVGSVFGREAGLGAGQALPPPPPYSAGTTPSYGIPLTAGQQAGDVNQQGFEQRVLHGAMGDPAQRDLAAFEANQQAILNEAETEARRRVTGRERASAADEMAQVQRGLEGRSQDLWDDVDTAFGLAREMDAGFYPEDVDELFGQMRGAFTKYELSTPEVKPYTHQILNRLEEFYPEVAEGQTIETVDAGALHALRQEIGFAIKDASNAEISNLKKLQKIIDDEMLRLADEGRMTGPPEGIFALQSGIELRADYGRLYGPRRGRFRSGRNKKDPAGQIIEEIIETDMTGEDVSKAVFGAGRMGSKSNTKKIFDRVEEAAGRESDEYRALQAAAMDRIRSQSISAGTENISPTKFRTEWLRLQREAPDLLDRIFTGDQRAEVDTLVQEMAETIYDPRAMNPSKTAHALERIMRQTMGPMAGMAVGGAMGGAVGAVAGAAAATGADAVNRGMKNAFGRLFASRTYRPLVQPDFAGKKAAKAFIAPGPVGRGLGQETERRLYEGSRP